MASLLFTFLAAVLVVCIALFFYVKKLINTKHALPQYDVSEVEGDAGHRLIRKGLTKAGAAALPQMDAIVVGSGIGGLTTAAILSRSGYKVLVLEQHDVAGGCTHVFQEGGYEFDTGLHYLGAKLLRPTSSSRKMFDALTGGKLKFAPMEDEYDVAVVGEESFGIPSGAGALREKLKKRFPQCSGGIDEYFRLLFDCVKSSQLFFALKLLPRWLSDFLTPLLCKKFYSYSDRTVAEVLDPVLKNKELLSIVAYLYGDYGLSPQKASFFMHCATAHHYISGACYPIGGSEMIARHATKVIQAAGGNVFVRSKVATLLMEGTGPSNARCVGVQLEKGDIQIRAPIVISATPAAVTFRRLVPRQFVPTEIIKSLEGPKAPLRPSVGHLSLTLGLRGSAKDLGLKPQNYWVFRDEKHDENSDAFFADKSLKAPFVALFISFPSTKDPEWDSRFPGKSTCAVITEAGSYEAYAQWEANRVRHRGDDYQKLKDDLTRRMLEGLYQQFPQLDGCVEFMELGTPLSNNYYLGADRGSSYGFAHNPERFRQAWLRPSTPIKGLYLSGQDIISAGVCGGLAGGFFAAGAVSTRVLLEHAKLL